MLYTQDFLTSSHVHSAWPLGPGKVLAWVAGLKREPSTHLLRTLTMAEKVTLSKFYLGHKNSCCAPPL